MLLKLIAFGAFLWVLARGAGWRMPLPRVISETLSFRKPAGQSKFGSCSDSCSDDDSDPDHADSEGYELGGGIVSVGPARNRVELQDDEDPPGLIERCTSWWERLVGDDVPGVVHETVEPEPPTKPTSREVQRAVLIRHLRRERVRPGLSATSIVRAAANQDDVPWGRVSERTMWSVWAQVCEEEAAK